MSVKTKEQNSIELANLEKTYKHNVTFYSEIPDSEMKLAEFEELAYERMKVLRILERVSGKSIKIYSKEWKEAVIHELNEEGLKGYVRLLKKTTSPVRADLEARRRDYLSHFILRLVYCGSVERCRWFTSHEIELFRLKLLDSTDSDIEHFIKLNNLNYHAITQDERNEIREGLIDSTMGMDASKIEISDIYKVPFLEVLDLIRNRRCYIKKRFAYVTAPDFISVLVTKHQQIIEEGSQFAAKMLPHLQEDDRLMNLIKNLHSSNTGKDYAVGNTADIPIESIDQLSKKSFPLCMRVVHDELRAKHHLKYGGRMQYGLFLKGIGVTLENSLRFWREEFTRVVDPEKFDKQYSYNIRHNYGKAGSMKDYAPYSCQKIINTAVGPMEVNGCPYKLLEGSTLRSRLTANGIGLAHVQEITSLASKGHYQLACGKYFEATHGTPLETGINHPNNYFDISQEIMNKRGEKVAAIKQVKNRQVQRVAGANSSKVMSSQNTSTQESQLDSSTVEELLGTPMDLDDFDGF